MGIVILLASLLVVAFGFFGGAKYLIKYYKTLFNNANEFSLGFKNKHQKWCKYLRYSLPVIILVFLFNAICALIGLWYVVARWIIEN